MKTQIYIFDLTFDFVPAKYSSLLVKWSWSRTSNLTDLHQALLLLSVSSQCAVWQISHHVHHHGNEKIASDSEAQNQAHWNVDSHLPEIICSTLTKQWLVTRKRMHFKLTILQNVFQIMTYKWPVPLFAIVVQHASAIKNKEPSLPVTPQIWGTFWKISLSNGLNLH